MSFTVDAPLLTAFVLALTRASAWLMIAPPFANRSIPLKVRAGLAAALAMFSASSLAKTDMPLSTGEFIGSLVMQAFVGMALGFACYLLFAAIQAAGGLIDNLAGFTLAQFYDPSSAHGEQASLFARYYQIVALTLLFVTNAHMMLLNGFLHSFKAVPASGFNIAHFDRFLVNTMGSFFVSALEIAAPVIAVLFITELGLGMLARAAPRLDIFGLAFPIRIVISLSLTAIALPVIAPALSNLVDRMMTAMGGG